MKHPTLATRSLRAVATGSSSLNRKEHAAAQIQFVYSKSTEFGQNPNSNMNGSELTMAAAAAAQ